MLVTDHGAKHLREEFEAGHCGSDGWEYLDKGSQVWRIRISKLASSHSDESGTQQKPFGAWRTAP